MSVSRVKVRRNSIPTHFLRVSGLSYREYFVKEKSKNGASASGQ